ncbi:MAG: ribosome maturation factor RimP [Actinobacteria bacterium]|nr:ribosome maturation factor RimP [Actinomycetota bacterium]
MRIEEQVENLIERVLESEGIEIVDIEYVPAPKGGRLTIYIDKEGGVDIDTCARVSELISPILDTTDIFKSRYYLEVSSPGIERRIKKRRDFERFKGREVRVETKVPVDGRRNFKGIISDVFEKSFVIAEESGEHEIRFDDIKKANLVVDIEF